MFDKATIRYECGIESNPVKCTECGGKWDGEFESSDGPVCSDCQQKFFEFEYMMLSRLKMDCKYYLGNGNRYNGHLWADTPSEHIGEMKRLYNILPVKPEWLTMEQIEEFEKEMVLLCYSKRKKRQLKF